MLTRLRNRKNNPDHIILEDSIKRRVDVTIEGLTASFNTLYNPISLCNSCKGKDNVITICDYIDSLKAEVNAAVHYRRDVVLLLARFSIFHNNQKKFNEITRADTLKFLDSFRKSEAIDPLHKWIGTYNIFRIHLIRFFRWLHSPEIEYNKRPRPSIIENIPKLKRKEISIYKPTG